MDLETGRIASATVIFIAKNHKRQDYWTLNGDLKITGDHPMLTVRNGMGTWVRVEDLCAGDWVRTLSGDAVVREILRVPEILDTVYVETDRENFIVARESGAYIVSGRYGSWDSDLIETSCLKVDMPMKPVCSV